MGIPVKGTASTHPKLCSPDHLTLLSWAGGMLIRAIAIMTKFSFVVLTMHHSTDTLWPPSQGIHLKFASELAWGEPLKPYRRTSIKIKTKVFTYRMDVRICMGKFFPF